MWIVIVSLVAVVAFLLTCLWVYNFTFRGKRDSSGDPYLLPSGEQYQKNKQRMFSLISEMDALPYERVFITSRDGLKLSARYYHVQDRAPVHIQCHGYRGNPVRDFCGGNKLAREAGHNTLVIDQRAHGESAGRAITFGVKERYDVIDWLNYLIGRFGPDLSVFLSGVSMGAATVLMASELELPCVKGIIADCPYSSPSAIIRLVAGKLGFPAFVSLPLAHASAFLLAGFRLNACSAEDAVKRNTLPVLLIHGEDDRFVPIDMSRRIAEAGGKRVTMAAFPNAGHGLCFIEDYERYKSLFESFIKKCIPN